jgi:hypothetical protein
MAREKQIIVDNETTSSSRHDAAVASAAALEEAIRQVTSTLCILVMAVPFDNNNDRPSLVMASTPTNEHLHVHWDDSSYNDSYDLLAATTPRTFPDDDTESTHACMHLWLQVSPTTATIVKELRVDKCSKRERH